MTDQDKFNASRIRRCEAFFWNPERVVKALANTAKELTEPYHLRVFEGLDEQGLPEIWYQFWSGSKPTKESAPCSPPINDGRPCPPFCD